MKALVLVAAALTLFASPQPDPPKGCTSINQEWYFARGEQTGGWGVLAIASWQDWLAGVKPPNDTSYTLTVEYWGTNELNVVIARHGWQSYMYFNRLSTLCAFLDDLHFGGIPTDPSDRMYVFGWKRDVRRVASQQQP